MSDTKKVQEVRGKMVGIFGAKCWMEYKLDKKNPFTYHHILEARRGGKVTIDNGALLTYWAHHDLNQMEEHDKSLYNALNTLFKELNKTKKPPTKEYFKEVNGILLFADKVITLSDYCTLNPDYGLLEEEIQKKLEKGKKPATGHLVYIPSDDELIEVPAEYRGKVKHKNRNNKRYTYRPTHR